MAKLVAGQSLVATAANFTVTAVSDRTFSRLLAWQQGRVAFNDTPLSAALVEMSRYAALPIKPVDAGAATVNVSRDLFRPAMWMRSWARWNLVSD